MIGVVELLCEKNNISCVFAMDTRARKVVFGKSVKKEVVHEHFKGETPDVSDSMLFCTWYVKSTNQEKQSQ